MGVRPPDLAGLSVEEKLDLISELWDSIEVSAEPLPLAEDQNYELRVRRSAGLSDPAATVVWSTVRKSLSAL